MDGLSYSLLLLIAAACFMCDCRKMPIKEISLPKLLSELEISQQEVSPWHGSMVWEKIGYKRGKWREMGG